MAKQKQSFSTADHWWNTSHVNERVFPEIAQTRARLTMKNCNWD